MRAGTRHESFLFSCRECLIVLIAITGWAAFRSVLVWPRELWVGGIDPRIEAEIAAVQQHGAEAWYAKCPRAISNARWRLPRSPKRSGFGEMSARDGGSGKAGGPAAADGTAAATNGHGLLQAHLELKTREMAALRDFQVTVAGFPAV